MNIKESLLKLHADMITYIEQEKRDQETYTANKDTFMAGCKQGGAGTATLFANRISQLITEIKQNESL